MSDLVEYKPGTPFPGVIGRNLDESSPARPQSTRARAGASEVIKSIVTKSANQLGDSNG